MSFTQDPVRQSRIHDVYVINGQQFHTHRDVSIESGRACDGDKIPVLVTGLRERDVNRAIRRILVHSQSDVVDLLVGGERKGEGDLRGDKRTRWGATRSARIGIALGLGWPRTSIPQSRTDRAGSQQKCSG